MGTWRVNRPAASDKIKDIPELCQDNFDAIEDIIGVEHGTFTDVGSGKHNLGQAGIVKIGTTTEITALTSPPTGAMGNDTSLGLLVRFDGAVWKYFGQDEWSRCRSYASSAQAITADSATVTAAYDTESYDTLSEFNTSTCTFTAKASGSYAIIASIGIVASATQAMSGTCSANGAIATSWVVSGAGTNLEAIEEYPIANDTDFNTSQSSAHSDTFSGSMPSFPSGSTGAWVSVNFRGRRRGCTCNNVCYSEGCTCNNICYVEGCTCNNTNYGGIPCSCNTACYNYYKTCDCYFTCYGYVTCSCNNTCYVHSCSCYNTVYGDTGCSCDSTCYAEDATKPGSFLAIGSTDYNGTNKTLSADWENFEEIWLNNPVTGLAWTSDAVTGVKGFGYKILETNASTSGVSADISQLYLTVSWFPSRPVITVGLYKNGTLAEAINFPVHEAGAVSNQTVQLFTILQLNPNDTLQVRVSKTIEDDIILGDSKYTFLAIHRLSGVVL